MKAKTLIKLYVTAGVFNLMMLLVISLFSTHISSVTRGLIIFLAVLWFTRDATFKKKQARMTINAEW